MKPETVARRRRARLAAQRARVRDTRAHLEAKADEEGPDSIWAEMLAEHQARWGELGRLGE